MVQHIDELHDGDTPTHAIGRGQIGVSDEHHVYSISTCNEGREKRGGRGKGEDEKIRKVFIR